ncbi:tetratricopeptide (TPR) repeat protein [Rhizobium petrolearium]|uniref:tetratricopeptide repeat protein n=1 Tax=Neorhizobium petrolearium TaxID=515361 RepID=UPI001AE8FB1A|nr:tetratricopeptide repeat protein [Neorhizobium petrolearium]MBP1843469.1 tetratricopeptide (TPR) repeat protein [Neorhizobium petrolearium]
MREFRLTSPLRWAGRRADETTELLPLADALAAADAARDRQDWANAALYYRQAVKHDPLRIELLVQLGHAWKELGDFDAALEAYRQFLDKQPHDADIHLQLGHLYNRMGEPETAFKWYCRAQALAPADPEVGHHFAAAGLRLSRLQVERKREEALELVRARCWQPARELLRELVTVDGETDLIAIYANVTKETGAFEQALGLYGDYRSYAQANDPKALIDVEIQIGHLHKAMGDFRSALQHYIRARDTEFELYDHVAPDSVSGHEIRSCMAEIYTCFWHAA